MKKSFIGKSLATAMAVAMAFTGIPAYAAEDTVAGFTCQTVDETCVADQTEIECFINSSFTVTIPKLIRLGGKDKKASYEVNVKGDIAGDEVVKVYPDASFTMKEAGGKADVTATVEQPVIRFVYAEKNTSDTTGSIAAEAGATSVGTITAPLTAGNWKGAFNFHISLLGADEEDGNGKFVIGGVEMTWDELKAAYPDAFDGTAMVQNADDECSYFDFEGKVAIDSEITEIGDYALYGNESMTELSLPGVTSIGEGAVSYCSSLTKVTLGDGLESVAAGAFSYTTLTSVVYKGVTYTTEADLLSAFDASGVTYADGIFEGINTSFTAD